MNNPLKDIISEEIRNDGTMSFHRFMELALYHSKFGYYENHERNIGKKGDFYTSVSTGTLFGELLGFQFAEWCSGFERFQIIEAGAHHGQLALDILSHFKALHPRLFSRMEYVIMEPSERREKKQRALLASFSRQIKWMKNWESIPPDSIEGVIFSNELLDAFPVHRLGWDAKEQDWFEWGVNIERGGFSWSKIGLSEHTLSEFLASVLQVDSMPESLATILPDGYTTEFVPDAIDWWNQASCRLGEGKLLTLDYGLETNQFFSPERCAGTLRAFHGHQLSGNLLDHIGNQDITASVNFSALKKCGELQGLRTKQFVSQESFLTGIVNRTHRQDSGFPEWVPARLAQLKTLIHPDHLGRAFKILVQSRQ